MNWHTLVTIGHIVGTVLGVGGATFAEIFHLKLANRKVSDETASDLVRTTYTLMRLGLVLLVISGFGYLLLLRFGGQAQYIYSPRVWVKIIITLVILVNALLLQIRKMPLWLGSAISITSWYAALVIGAWRVHAGFWTLIAAYALAVLLIALVKKMCDTQYQPGEKRS